MGTPSTAMATSGRLWPAPTWSAAIIRTQVSGFQLCIFTTSSTSQLQPDLLPQS